MQTGTTVTLASSSYFTIIKLTHAAHAQSLGQAGRLEGGRAGRRYRLEAGRHAGRQANTNKFKKPFFWCFFLENLLPYILRASRNFEPNPPRHLRGDSQPSPDGQTDRICGVLRVGYFIRLPSNSSFA
jgi:hypothetical protein